MALNFPSSPTDGQQYQNWIYDSAKGAWEAKPLEAMAATPSPTAPLTPQSGDMWYNTNDGGVYVYYNDGNTSQWVQMKSDATLSSTLGERTTTLENKLGLSRIIPPTIAVSGGSATANSLGFIDILAATSVSFNNVFDSNKYSAYRLILTNFAVTNTGGNLRFQFRGGGSSHSTASYERSGFYTWAGGSTIGTQNGTAQQYIEFIQSFWLTNSIIDIFPHNSSNTQRRVICSSQGNGSGNQAGYVTGSFDNTGLTVDGFTIFPSSNAMNGTLQLFGYNR